LKTGDANAARAEREIMRASLRDGAFAVDRGTYEFLSEKLGTTEEPVADLAMARAADAWSSRWLSDGCGRQAEQSSGVALIGFWCRSEDDVRVAIVRAGDMFNDLLQPADSMQVSVVIRAGDRAIWGTVAPEALMVERQLSELDLPWRMEIQRANPVRAEALLKGRRRLAAGGLALMIAIVASAGFFVFRSVSRELEIARLQSDFISTVSHEFRTPLTAMNHLAEMLREKAVPADRVPQYYDALHRETNRLHRVVESLLDFRRFESGRHAYRMEPMEADDAVRQVVDSYATREDSGRLQVSLDAGRTTIRGDRDAVAVAVGNLVDNALKYSPADAPVSIQVAPRGQMVGITVEDRGPGLSRHEQRRVFRKFVRGAAAQEANVKGTGIGLAIVHAVVKAHGGRVDLHSSPGHGSRFTLLLPRA
jgi:signal transduction histidine kinase